MCSRDKPYSMLKPGQTRLDRDYYKDVTTEKPNGELVVKNYSRFSSIYNQNQNANVKVGDYKVPAKSMNTMSKCRTPRLTLFRSWLRADPQAIIIQPHRHRQAAGEGSALREGAGLERNLSHTDHGRRHGREARQPLRPLEVVVQGGRQLHDQPGPDRVKEARLVYQPSGLQLRQGNLQD